MQGLVHQHWLNQTMQSVLAARAILATGKTNYAKSGKPARARPAAIVETRARNATTNNYKYQ